MDIILEILEAQLHWPWHLIFLGLAILAAVILTGYLTVRVVWGAEAANTVLEVVSLILIVAFMPVVWEIALLEIALGSVLLPALIVGVFITLAAWFTMQFVVLGCIRTWKFGWAVVRCARQELST